MGGSDLSIGTLTSFTIRDDDIIPRFWPRGSIPGTRSEFLEVVLRELLNSSPNESPAFWDHFAEYGCDSISILES